jgi:cell division septal protein FtsQ
VKEKNHSIVQSLFWIVISALVSSGGAFLAYQSFESHKIKQLNSPEFFIKGIYQTGTKKEAIPTQILSELIGLSCDKPTHIYQFDTKKAEAKLKAFPFIKQAKITKKKPDALYIDYSIREPIAVVKDYSDLAVDEEGVLFSYKQFFSPQSLIEIYLGGNFQDKKDVDKRKQLALSTLQLLNKKFENTLLSIKKIDVSNAYLESFGKRELVVLIDDKEEETFFPYYLRMSLFEPEKQLTNFLVLRKELSKQHKLWKKLSKSSQDKPKPKVIDLRMQGMALIEEESP